MFFVAAHEGFDKCSSKAGHSEPHVGCCVCSRLQAIAMRKGEASDLVVTKPPAPAPAEPANVSMLAEGVAESGGAAAPTVASTPPTADQETSVSGGGVPPPVEQETTGAPPLADRAGEGGTTDPPPDANTRRMEEVVGDLPPIPLKLLVLSMLGGDGWRPSKGPQVDDREGPQVTPPSEDPVSATTTVSTCEWLLVLVLCL
jgi:hypothetical protein